MFAKATRNFLRDIDAGGDLISVASLNDADKVNLLSVVAKKKRFWCWQKPKYHFSSLTCMLSDVLTEEKPVKPVVVESEFVKYEGVWGDVIQGNMDADVGTLHMNAAGVGYVESQSSFGDLRKQEVDMQLLMKDVQERAINLDHPFIQQLHERKNDVLCILKEKIVTTQKCVIAEHTQTGEKYGGKIGIKAKMVKVSVSENGNFIKDENTVLEIPPPTAIAYGVVELYVKRDGHFGEILFVPEKQGGFEKETAERNRHPRHVFMTRHRCTTEDVVDEISAQVCVRFCVLRGADILELKKHFSAWEKLPEVQRLHLYELLCEILFDGQTVAQLQNVLEEICSAHKPHLTVLDELKPPQKRRAQDILHLIGYHMENEKLLDQKHQAITDLLVALHFLTSALDEMSDSCLAILGTCCELQLLPGLCALPNIASDEGLCSRTDPLLSDFIDQGRFQIVQRLFSSSNMNLEMNEHTLKAATTKEPGFLPHILYIAISGFHALKNLKM
ncbi:hypothetical protein FKM82_006731 [Ascaphus truei]